jgi:hypothetical protein
VPTVSCTTLTGFRERASQKDQNLRRAAQQAAIQWRYMPATIDGKPVEANNVTVDVVFSQWNAAFADFVVAVFV